MIAGRPVLPPIDGGFHCGCKPTAATVYAAGPSGCSVKARPAYSGRTCGELPRYELAWTRQPGYGWVACLARRGFCCR